MSHELIRFRGFEPSEAFKRDLRIIAAAGVPIANLGVWCAWFLVDAIMCDPAFRAHRERRTDDPGPIEVLRSMGAQERGEIAQRALETVARLRAKS